MYVLSVLSAQNESTGHGCQSCSWSAEQGKLMLPCPRSRLRMWPCEMGSAVLSHVSEIIFTLNPGLLLPLFAAASIYLYPQQSSSQSQVYQVTQYCVSTTFTAESPPAQGQYSSNVVPVINNCKRSELLICKVHQFGIGCIKNGAHSPTRIPFRDFFVSFRRGQIRYFFYLIFGYFFIHFGTAYVLFRGRCIR